MFATEPNVLASTTKLAQGFDLRCAHEITAAIPGLLPWGRFKMTKQYDLIALGPGTGASGAAARCSAAGWKVAVIDHLTFGGNCEGSQAAIGFNNALLNVDLA